MSDMASSRFRLRYGAALLCGLFFSAPPPAEAETWQPDPPPQDNPGADAVLADHPYLARRKAFREPAAQPPAGAASLPDRSVLLPAPAVEAAISDPDIAGGDAVPVNAAPKELHSPAALITRRTFHLIPPASARVETTPMMPNLAELSPAAGPADLETMVPLIPVPAPAASRIDPDPGSDVRVIAEPSSDIPPPPLVRESPADAQYGVMALDNLLLQLKEPYGKASVAPDVLPDIPAISQPPDTAAAEIVAPDTEPAAALSAESREILKKIPAGMDRKKAGGPDRVDIDRSRDTQYVSSPKGDAQDQPDAAPAPVQHEAMGMKIAVKHAPVNINYELEKAYNALIGGHSHAAIEIYKNVLSNDPKNKDALFGLATTYHRAGQVDMARPLYGKLLSLDSGHRDALNNFLVLLADEAPQEALEQLERLEENNPDFSPIPAQLAVIYQKLGQPDRASDKMFKAVALAPENLTYRYNLAILLDKQQKHEEAVRLYRQLVEAHMRGEIIPGNIQKIQERLTFLRSNR